MKDEISSIRAADDLPFMEAWAQMERDGYQYSESNIEKVHLGWLIAAHEYRKIFVIEYGSIEDHGPQITRKPLAEWPPEYRSIVDPGSSDGEIHSFASYFGDKEARAKDIEILNRALLHLSKKSEEPRRKLQRFPGNRQFKPFLSYKEYKQLRGDDRFLYNCDLDLLCTHCGKSRERANQDSYNTCAPPFKFQEHLFDGKHPSMADPEDTKPRPVCCSEDGCYLIKDCGPACRNRNSR